MRKCVGLLCARVWIRNHRAQVHKLVPIALDRKWVALDRAQQRLNFGLSAANTKTQKPFFFFLFLLDQNRN
jgi:hypothetical protein